MKTLPASLLLEKNKLATKNPWLVLLDVYLTDDTELYFVKNTENITFSGREYSAINFEIEPTKESTKGEIPTVTLRVSNVTRILQAHLEALSGAVGSSVTVRVVNAAHLTENYSELEMTLDVLSSHADALWVAFTLGAPNPLRRRFPLYRYIADHCAWAFKGRECNYTGGATSCKRTLDDCRNLNNSVRFGGFKGLSGGNVRLA